MTEMLAQGTKETAWLSGLAAKVYAFFVESVAPRLALQPVSETKLRFLWGLPSKDAVQADGARQYEVLPPTRRVKTALKGDIVVLDGEGEDRDVNITGDGAFTVILSPLVFTKNTSRFGRSERAVQTGDVALNMLRGMIVASFGQLSTPASVSITKTVRDTLGRADWSFPQRTTYDGKPKVTKKGEPMYDLAHFEPAKTTKLNIDQIAAKHGQIPPKLALDLLALKRPQEPNPFVVFSVRYTKADGSHADINARVTGANGRDLYAAFAASTDGVLTARLTKVDDGNIEAANVEVIERESQRGQRGGRREGAGRPKTTGADEKSTKTQHPPKTHKAPSNPPAAAQ